MQKYNMLGKKKVKSSQNNERRVSEVKFAHFINFSQNLPIFVKKINFRRNFPFKVAPMGVLEHIIRTRSNNSALNELLS